MSEMSDKWDAQWTKLLTHCYGVEVEANANFKANLLDELKSKAAENREPAVADQAEDEKWSRLMKAAYVPCHSEDGFKSDLLGKLKAKQREVASVDAAGAAESADDSAEDRAMRKILTRVYQPVAPRREFETRLLENLKERQRNTVVYRKTSNRRTIFFSAASGIAAAAMVAFVLWTGPVSTSTEVTPSRAISGTQGAVASLPVPSSSVETASTSSIRNADGNLHLPVPDSAATPVERVESADSGRVVAASANALADVAPASYEVMPASFTSYRVADAFTGPALPEQALGLQNIEYNAGKGWVGMGGAEVMPLVAGLAFRSRGGMGHVRFSDGSIITVSPNALMSTSEAGLTVERGLALVSVPDSSRAGFRLHFPERDIAIEPGTDLAVMVESPEGYAEGGAPAPMVMVVDRQDSPGGLALARGSNGIGPLLAKQIYRLDRYVTPALPGRALCDTECQDIDKFFKMETVRQVGHPMASFAGGFSAGDREMGYTAMVLTPAGYSKRGDKWVSDKYAGEPTVKLKYLSDAYFGFANERRDLARDLALGSEVVIDGGDGKFYEITK